MSTPVATSDATFNEDLDGAAVNVVDFWATWCGPCRQFEPIFAQSAEANPDVKHLKVDVDENPALSQYFEIQAVPTTVFLRDGIVIGKVPGALNASGLAELIEQAQHLDMGAVRAEVQAQNPE